MPALAPPGASVLEISPTPPLHLPYIFQVHMSVLESSRRAPGVYERKVVMHARGEEIMQVCWRARRRSRSRSLRPRLAAHPSSRTHTSPPPLAPSRRAAWCT